MSKKQPNIPHRVTSINISVEDRHRVRRIAYHQDTSITSVIRTAIKEYLDKIEEQETFNE